MRSAERKGHKNREKNVTTLSGMIFRNFVGNKFFPVGPHVVVNGDLVVFWPVLGHGHLKKFRAGSKTEKRDFPALRFPKSTKNTTLSGIVVRNCFTFYVLPERSPRGGKSRNIGFLGPFGLGHLEKFRARVKNGKTHFPGARGPKTEEKS